MTERQNEAAWVRQMNAEREANAAALAEITAAAELIRMA